MNTPDRSFEIRAVKPEDAPALSRLLAELGFPAAVEVVAQRLGILARAGETAFVGVWGTGVIGFVTVHVTPVLHRPTPVGRLTALAVTSWVQGQGAGRALVEAAEHALADAGCAVVEVTSNLELSRAHAFYEHLGYQRTSYRFWKALPPAATRAG
jgi:ribosomal protein S18 acetylase RimI-like enzyme